MVWGVALPWSRGVSVERLAYFVALGVAILSGLFFIAMPFVAPFSDPGQPDEAAYYLAANRLLHGDPLYLPSYADSGEVYRYAPWFAVAWVPLALLPESVAYLLWEAVLLACAIYVIWTLAHMGRAGIVMAALGLPLIGAVPGGNVTNLMLAVLIWRRADPWSVGLAGSLKVYPLLLTAGFIAERRWRDFATAWTLAALLWLPALWLGWQDNILTGQKNAVLPAVFAIPALGVVAALAIIGSRWTWLAVGAALPLAVPHYVSIGYTWVAAVRLSHGPLHRVDDDRAVAGRRSVRPDLSAGS